MTARPPSARTTVRRLPKRARYDRQSIDAILDEALFCHVGFVEAGRPVVLPMVHGRTGDRLYLHGSAAGRMLTTLADGVDACVTATLVDGLVLARSAFHHSVNYRAAVVFGRAQAIEGAADKMEALRVVVDHAVPGRWDEVRPPSAKELRATLVLELSLDEASAKVRTGPPLDDEEDLARPVWAGELPLVLEPRPPVPDPRLPAATPISTSITRWRFPPARGL